MIRKIELKDRHDYEEMAREFYSSEAVVSDVPDKSISDTFEEIINSSPFIQGYMLISQDQGIAGYALVAKSYSQEAGGKVLWLEESFIKPSCRSQGLAFEFLTFMKEELTGNMKRIRLEVEGGNENALALYRRNGFEKLPYMQLIIDL
ncbi:MAG: GNAT family N-acetyltransferase [Clostridiales bacterium]|nr:GNAT family N-acetyltransferase [Clostridiales bacterium]